VEFLFFFLNEVEIDNESFAIFRFVRVEFDLDVAGGAGPVDVTVSTEPRHVLTVKHLQVVIQAFARFFDIILTLKMNRLTSWCPDF